MVISDGKEFRIKHPRIHVTGTTLIVIFLIFFLIGWSVTSIQKGILEQKRERRIAEAIDFCESLFDQSIIKTSIAEAELKDCDERIQALGENNERTELIKVELTEAYKYFDVKKSLSEWFDENNIVKESLDERDLTAIHESAEKLTDQYKELVAEQRNQLQSEYDKMREAENLTNNLFTSVDRTDVNPNAERGAYDNAKNHVNELAQENLKQSLNQSLDKVLPVIEEKERIAREQAEAARRAREEEARKIRESWHVINIPVIINQHNEGFDNGCEAASLYMAAVAKGRLGGSFNSFANRINATVNENSPYEGFYLSMKELEPRDRAHWIVPSLLAGYVSGAEDVTDKITSIDGLNQEVANGNPVVIYLTYNFNNPTAQTAPAPVNVPKNLHVLVLAGFNSYTGEEILYDPWPKYGNAKQTVSKSRIEYLYNASGRRALVVR